MNVQARGFDVVVVGAGSAGCVVAARLVEAGARVLLVEAGGARFPRESRIPAAFSRLFRTRWDWAYETEPETELAGRRLFWPRGKGVGGSGGINAMIWIRGHPADFDGWRKAGAPGWGWDDVRPYFERAEARMSVLPLRCVNPISAAFVDAGAELGHPRNADFNGAAQEGFGLYRVTQRRGARWSTADAYVAPARRTGRFSVAADAHVTRVATSGTRATGVEWIRDGAVARAEAAQEVILCAGAIGTPQLLLQSGIGRADALRKLGIDVLVDLPGVGENLQDHLAVGIGHDCTQPISLARGERPAALLHWLLLRGGPLTSNVAEAGGFVRLGPGDGPPDLQFHFGPVWFEQHGLGRRPGHGFTFAPTLLHPESRGRLRLRSADPLAPAVLEPRYLSAPADLARLVDGLELARALAATRALAPFRGAEVLPGPGVRDRAGLAQWVRARAETLYHPVGTCRIGHDADSVVDARLRVHGVERLRVADASVMPLITGGNTNAPTIMIAERTADLARAR